MKRERLVLLLGFQDDFIDGSGFIAFGFVDY